MNLPFWLGMYLVSTSWLFLTDVIFSPPSPLWGYALTALGVLAMGFGAISLKAAPFGMKRAWIYVLVPALAFFLLPHPYNMGFSLVAVGTLLAVLYRRSQRLSVVLQYAGLTMLVQAAAFIFLVPVSARLGRLDSFIPLTNLVTRLLGVSSVTSGATMFIETALDVIPFAASATKLGIFPLAVFLTSGVFWLGLTTKSAAKWGSVVVRLLLVAMVYGICRFAFLSIIYASVLRMWIFFSPPVFLASFLPLPFLIGYFLYRVGQENLTLDLTSPAVGNITQRRAVIASCVAFSLFFILTFAASFYEPGERKAGRVLIDESHSQWERTTEAMNTENYGRLTVYNYYSFGRFLEHYFRLDKHIEGELTKEILTDFDVLIIKTPTKSFSSLEIAAIRQFVREGGGLLLIGDHTNVMGTSYYLDQIARHFGFSFNFDMVNDLGTGKAYRYKPPRLFAHPLVQQLTTLDFLTSCSLTTAAGVESVINSNHTSSDEGDYSNLFFFRRTGRTPEFDFGPFVLAAAARYGKGRVVAFTDSTIFSNFAVFMDGYTPFALAVVEFLNHTNRYPFIKPLLWYLSGLLFVIFIALLRRGDRALVAGILLIGFSIAVPSGLYAGKKVSHIKLPAPHTEYTSVVFDREYSNYGITPGTMGLKTPGDDYRTFFVWTQRMNYFPSLSENLALSLSIADAVVVINPVRSFDNTLSEEIYKYVNEGGAFIVMDSPFNKNSTAGELLPTFDVEIMPVTMQSENEEAAASVSLAVEGMEQVKHNLMKPRIFSKSVGQGILVVVPDGEYFSNRSMGDVFGLPNEGLRELYEAEFILLRIALGEWRSKS